MQHRHVAQQQVQVWSQPRLTAHILQLHAGLGKTVPGSKKNATQLAVRAGIEPRGVRSAELLGRRLSHWTKASAKTYVKMFEGPVTGNIPEVLDNGEVTEGTHVTAGQLALALTPYAQVADLAVNTAASGNNAAAIQSLDDRVTAELASKLDSSALIAPLATAAALATTDGQVAAHGSSIAALQSSLTTGLSNKADQSAFDVLEGVVATKSTRTAWTCSCRTTAPWQP